MRRLGNKNEARKMAMEAKVPVVPGSEGLITKEEDALRLADVALYLAKEQGRNCVVGKKPGGLAD